MSKIDSTFWAEGMARVHHVSSALLDPVLFRREVERLAEIGIGTLADAHMPPLRGVSLPRAFDELARLLARTPEAPS